MDYKTLDKVFILHLKDIYSCEQQMVEALPRLLKSSENDELKLVFKNNLEQAKNALREIEKIFEKIPRENPWGENSNAMEGFIEEIEEFLEEGNERELEDAELISMLRKIKYFEISNYETVVSYGRALTKDSEVSSLQKMLEEKVILKETLHKLSEKLVKVFAKV